MALYFKDIEITNIDNLVPQSGLDITDIWFGSTNIYTVWQTYEGALPATLNANGADMRQYQVYGAAGGVGDRTANLFDYRDYVDGYYISSSGIEIEASRDPSNRSVWLSHSGYISILPDESYTMSAHHQNMSTYQAVAIAWYDENKNFISRDSTTIPRKDEGTYSFTATAPQNAKFAIFNFFTDDVQRVMFTPGTTPPQTYVPFGYELDMSVKSAQLFDKNATHTDNGYIENAYLKSNGTVVSYDGTNVSEYIPVLGSTVYILRYGLESGYYNSPSVCFYDISKNFISGSPYSNNNPKSFTTPAAAAYARLSFSKTDVDVVVLTKGSTIPEPLPPYSNTTTPIYIGDDPLWAVNAHTDYVDYQAQKVVREIKKYVLDGSEDWRLQSGSGGDATKAYFRLFIEPLNYLNTSTNASSCSHFNRVNVTSSSTSVGYAMYNSSSAKNDTLNIRPENIATTTLSDFKTWLAEQYAAGTPVTVWCALTIAEETDPPVTLSALPTCEGETIIDYVGQSVAPEKAILKYRKKNF